MTNPTLNSFCLVVVVTLAGLNVCSVSLRRKCKISGQIKFKALEFPHAIRGHGDPLWPASFVTLSRAASG